MKGATPPDMRVALIAAEQNAVVSRRQLRACGLSDPAITLRLRRGTLHRLHRGVYSVVGPSALSAKGRLTGAVLACGCGAVLSHAGAAAWWGLGELDERPPEVTVPRGAGRKLAGIRVHRSRALDRRDVWQREHIAVTSPARTALDLAPGMAPAALRRLLRQAEADGLVTLAQLRDVLSRSNGHRGARALRAVLDDAPTPTRSAAEDLLLDLVEGAGLPRPDVNVRLRVAATVLMPDFLWRDRRVIVEVDGLRYHRGRVARADDARRQAILEADGYRVLRISHAQLTRGQAQTIARIARALGEDRGCARPPL